jgi:hypothetical protein
LIRLTRFDRRPAANVERIVNFSSNDQVATISKYRPEGGYSDPEVRW